MSDWRVGDLAVCVDDSPCHCGCGVRPAKVGRVAAAYLANDIVRLTLDDMAPGSPRGWRHTRFRKIRPDEQEACEPEFVTLLQRIKRKQQVTVGCHNHTATITFTPGPATQWLLGIADQLKQSKGRECGLKSGSRTDQ